MDIYIMDIGCCLWPLAIGYGYLHYGYWLLPMAIGYWLFPYAISYFTMLFPFVIGYFLVSIVIGYFFWLLLILGLTFQI
jgi:hypothetical protein